MFDLPIGCDHHIDARTLWAISLKVNSFDDKIFWTKLFWRQIMLIDYPLKLFEYFVCGHYDPILIDNHNVLDEKQKKLFPSINYSH